MLRTSRGGRAPAAIVAFCLLALASACGEQATAPEIRTRIFRVTSADGQALPAHHVCPAPAQGVATGSHFVEGELALYPGGSFTWRYTLRQYVATDGGEEAWVEPTLVRGSYTVQAAALALTPDQGASRSGRLTGARLELAEPIRCPYAATAQDFHLAELHLAEAREG